jgi:hypothetical protein
MRRTLRVLAWIAGSLIGSLAGGVLLYLAAWAVAARAANGNEDAGFAYGLLLCPPRVFWLEPL